MTEVLVNLVRFLAGLVLGCIVFLTLLVLLCTFLPINEKHRKE